MTAKSARKKICPRCNKNKWLKEFSVDKTKPSGRCSWCKACYREREDEIRRDVMKKLGGVKCHECGCDVFSILEINHVNGDGAIERKTINSKTLLRLILAGKADLKRYNVTCKVCNTHHYVEKMLGIKGHKVIWKP